MVLLDSVVLLKLLLVELGRATVIVDVQKPATLMRMGETSKDTVENMETAVRELSPDLIPSPSTRSL